MTAACAGFVYALNIGALMISSGQCRHILVVGAELISPVIDWTARNTCVLFGDAAGAVVLSECGDTRRGVLASVLESSGSAADILYLKSHGNGDVRNYLQMDGKAVFRIAVQSLTDVVRKGLAKVNLGVEEVDLAVFHQANARIINSVAHNLKLPAEKVFFNGHKYGNTSAASIPLALAEAEQQGLLSPGKVVVLAAIGGGMSWGCNVIRW